MAQVFFSILTLLYVVSLFVCMGYWGYLRYKYNQPYQLSLATTKQKWKWAARINLFLIGPFLILALVFPLIRPEDNNPWWTSLFCVGLLVPLYVILVLMEMIGFAFSQLQHNWTSRVLNKNREKGLDFDISPVFSLFGVNKDTQQFFRQGYPENRVEGEQRDINALANETPIYQSVSQNKRWRLSVYGPAINSPVFYAYFKNLEDKEESFFPFGYFAPVDQLSVKWNVGDNTCGLYICRQCYALFYYGEEPRRSGRSRSRIRKENALTSSFIRWFVNNK